LLGKHIKRHDLWRKLNWLARVEQSFDDPLHGAPGWGQPQRSAGLAQFTMLLQPGSVLSDKRPCLARSGLSQQQFQG
jgi:hypothetical protein